MTGYKIVYMDRRGAGCIRFFNESDEAALDQFVSALRCEATIYDQATNEKLGEIWRDTGESDDRRRRWNWGYESCQTSKRLITRFGFETPEVRS